MDAPTLIFTSRDPASCLQLIPIIRQAKEQAKAKVLVIAQGVSADLLTREGIPFRFFDGWRAGTSEQVNYLVHPEDLELQQWLVAAENILSGVSQGVLVTGNSSLGFGVDEIFRYVVQTRRPDIFCFTYYDFWSGGNALGGALADIGLVLDSNAAVNISSRMGIDCVAVGSPRHEAESMATSGVKRNEAREYFGAAPDDVLVGFVAQMQEVPGYDENFQYLVEAIQEFSERRMPLIIKTHPKYPEEGARLAAIADGFGVRTVVYGKAEPLHNLLAALDAVFVCTSMVCMDYAQYVARSSAPLGFLAHLFIGQSMQRHMSDIFGFLETPLVRAGVGWNVTNPEDLRKLLRDATCEKKYAATYHRRAAFLNSDGSTRRFLDQIYPHIKSVPKEHQ